MNNDNYFEIPNTKIEESSFEVECQLVDAKLEPILSGNITKLTLTTYAADVRGNPIIGKNDKVNIFNANQGTITAGGKLTLAMKPKDTPITVANQINKYIALVEWTFGAGGAEEGKFEFAYYVRPGVKVR